MHPILQGFNWICSNLFQALYFPLSFLGELGSLVMISLLAGLLMVWLFGRISNQAAIREIRDKIQANLIALRLFKDELAVFFRIQGRIFRETGRYMKLSLIPMLVMIVPVVLIIIQLDLRYARRPIKEGEAFLLKVVLSRGDALTQNTAPLTIEVKDGLVVETPGVRVPQKREISWRLRAQTTGVHQIQVRFGDTILSKDLIVGTGNRGWVSGARTGKSALDMLLHPGEAPIHASAAGIESIKINYPERELSLAGFNIHWLAAFFILSIAFGFLFKRPLGVAI